MRPNLIFILADDLGHADLGCYGGRAERISPSLDRMAAAGMRFTRAYANSPVCSPTRFALITGRYQYRLRGAAEEPMTGKFRGSTTVGLPPEHPTLPSLLRAAGYRTALVGKWHLGYPPHFGPRQSGYEEHIGPLSGGVSYFTHLDRAGKVDLVENGEPVDHQGRYLTDLLSDRAVDYVHQRAQDRQPFLLSLHYTAPHWPWETRDAPAQPAITGATLAHVEGGKMDLTEGGIRVPCLARWPQVIAPGSVSAQHLLTMDWTATFLAAAGVAADPGYPLDGVPLQPALADATHTFARPMYWRMKHRDQRALRDGQWKYLKIDAHEYLFDVEADERERANRARAEPERLAAMRAQWEAVDATMPSIPADAAVSLVYGLADMPAR